MYPYKQTARWQDVLDTVAVTGYEPEPHGWKPGIQYQVHPDIGQTAYTDRLYACINYQLLCADYYLFI